MQKVNRIGRAAVVRAFAGEIGVTGAPIPHPRALADARPGIPSFSSLFLEVMVVRTPLFPVASASRRHLSLSSRPIVGRAAPFHISLGGPWMFKWLASELAGV